MRMISFQKSALNSRSTWGREAAADRVAGRVKGELRQQLAAHLVTLGPIYARGERSGELTNTAVEGIEALDAYFRQYLPQLALAALVPLTVLLPPLPSMRTCLTRPEVQRDITSKP